MKKKTSYRIILIAILIIFTFSAVPAAQAVGPGPNAVLGFLRTLEALNKRNQIYREAGVTADEIKTYYDTLIGKTKTMRDDIIHQAAKGKDVTSLIRAYTRIEAGLLAERDVAIQMVEAEKKGARADFHKTLRKEVFEILIASPGAQRMLKDIRETIDGLRQAVHTVQDALSGNQLTEVIANQFAERVGDTQWKKRAAYVLGSAVAEELDERTGGILSSLDQPSNLIQGELDEALKKIDELDHHLAKYQNQDVTPTSLRGSWDSVNGFQEVDPSQSGADAVAAAYSNKASKLGLFDSTDFDRVAMRDRIREALLEAKLSYFSEDTKSEAKFVKCEHTNQHVYLFAMRELGLTPEEALDPERSKYLVCYYRTPEAGSEAESSGSGVPGKVAFAALIGLSKADEAAQADQVADSEKRPSDTGGYNISVDSDQPQTIESLWANELASRIGGNCPAVPAEYAWAVEHGHCQSAVYYDIDSLSIDLNISEDSSKPWAEINLTGHLTLQLLDDLGEYGEGTITADGPLQNLTITESSSGSLLVEGTIPINISSQGEHVVLSIYHAIDADSGYVEYFVLEEGGIQTTIDALVTLDTAARRLEIRYEEYPLEIATGYGDGKIIEALRLDIALFWAEGQLTHTNQ